MEMSMLNLRNLRAGFGLQESRTLPYFNAPEGFHFLRIVRKYVAIAS